MVRSRTRRFGGWLHGSSLTSARAPWANARSPSWFPGCLKNCTCGSCLSAAGASRRLAEPGRNVPCGGPWRGRIVSLSPSRHGVAGSTATVHWTSGRMGEAPALTDLALEGTLRNVPHRIAGLCPRVVRDPAPYLPNQVQRHLFEDVAAFAIMPNMFSSEQGPALHGHRVSSGIRDNPSVTTFATCLPPTGRANGLPRRLGSRPCRPGYVRPTKGS